MDSTGTLFANVLSAWNRRDMDAVAQQLHPDFEWIEHSSGPHEGPVWTGTSAVEHVTADIEEGIDDYRAEVIDVVEIDAERAVVLTRETGRGATSGAPFSTEFGYVVTVRDGKMLRVQAHRHPHEALAAVGHSDEASGA